MRVSSNGLRVLIVVWALALAAFCLASLGCGGAAPAPSGTVVAVNEADFQIAAPTHLRAGEYALRVRTEGPTEHELIVARLSGSSLPMRHDGLTVDEEALQGLEPGSLDPAPAGSVRYLQVHLAPGRYVLFCNMEGHYMAGMRHELVVTS